MGKMRQETYCKTGDRRRETRDERKDKGDRSQERVLCADRKYSAKFEM